MYGKWLINPEFVHKLFFRGSIFGLTLVTTILLRSYGRAANPKYQAFYKDLINANLEYSVDNKVCNTNTSNFFNNSCIYFKYFNKTFNITFFFFSEKIAQL